MPEESKLHNVLRLFGFHPQSDGRTVIFEGAYAAEESSIHKNNLKTSLPVEI